MKENEKSFINRSRAHTHIFIHIFTPGSLVCLRHRYYMDQVPRSTERQVFLELAFFPCRLLLQSRIIFLLPYRKSLDVLTVNGCGGGGGFRHHHLRLRSASDHY